MNNQKYSPRLAAGRNQPEGNAPPTLDDKLRTVARRLMFTVPNLAAADRQFLWDIEREERRYSMILIERMTSISSRSTDVGAREAFSLALRDEALRNVPQVCTTTAADVETQLQGPADVAVRQYEHSRCRANAERALECLARHRAALTQLFDSISHDLHAGRAN